MLSRGPNDKTTIASPREPLLEIHNLSVLTVRAAGALQDSLRPCGLPTQVGFWRAVRSLYRDGILLPRCARPADSKSVASRGMAPKIHLDFQGGDVIEESRLALG